MQKLKTNKIYLSDSIWGQVSHLSQTLSKIPETLLSKRVVICEEKFTLSLEKALAEKLSGIMTTRVLSFGKICDEVKTTSKYLSKQGEVMLLSKIIGDMEGELELFSAACKMPSFASSIYDILSLLASSHVDFDSIEEKQLPPALSKKIGDICKIQKKYTLAKKGMFLDATDKMEALFQSFDSVHALKDAEIFILGHTAFTNQMLAVISKMALAGGVSIYLLENSKKLTSNVSQIFENCGVKFETQKIESEFSPLQKEVASGIARNSQKIEGDLDLITFSCEEFEAENIAIKIKRLINSGVKPSEISLVLANFQNSVGGFCELFDRYKIPYFTAVSKTLEQFPFPTHILNLAQLAISKYSLDSVTRVLKSPFSPLTFEESCVFENFLVSRNVDRGRFFKDEIFSFETLEYRNRFLKGTNTFEKMALSPLEFAEVCENLAKENIDTLARISCDITSLGEVDSADFLSLSIKKTFEVISEMQLVLGDELFTLERILEIFEGGLCGKEISTIPAHLHAVEITDTAKSILSEKSHAFIASASKSFFPAYKKDVALLSDKDILTLATSEIDISPSVEFLNDNEDIICDLALLSAKDSLTISYSELCGGGKETPSPAFSALAKVRNVTSLNSEYHIALEEEALTLEEALSSTEASKLVAKAMLDFGVFEESHAISLFAREVGKENTIALEISKGIYSAFEELGKADILDEIAKVQSREFAGVSLLKAETSSSHLESYFRCPYSSFLSQNIRLFDREVGFFQAFDSGNFLHYLLEEFSAKIEKISESEISSEVSKIANSLEKSPAFSKFAVQEKYQYVLKRLTREAEKICTHIYKSKEISNFHQKYHELSFGGKNPIATPNGLKIRGIVDRVDTLNQDLIVIDYKTGTIDIAEDKVYHGLKIQSELYLYAAAKLTGKTPRGCLYFPISDDYKDAATSYRMKGKLSKNDDFLGNLDAVIGPKESSEIYPIKRNQDGSFKKENHILEEDSFSSHIEKAVKTAEQGGRELSLGYISPSPYQSGKNPPCEYCSFVSICKSCGENSTRCEKLEKEDTDNG